MTDGIAPFGAFPFDDASKVLTRLIEDAYSASRFAPRHKPSLELPQAQGTGMQGFEQFLGDIVSGAAGLSAPGAFGHMDTAPHPVAAFTDALVSATNNNLLFRELSPFASEVEEKLLTFLASHLALESDWHGTFCSGGSLANLTALFASVGGYQNTSARTDFHFIISECAHTSVYKSLAILGIADKNIHKLWGDDVGRSTPDDMAEKLTELNDKKCVVIAVAGSTVHGAMEDLRAIGSICQQHKSWLHVDAVHGGAVGFSVKHRSLLMGLDLADSISFGPQKWMYVPRLCAVVWVKGQQRFDDCLGMDMPYSATGQHRGRWGVQGSRRADALTLWAVLHYLGTEKLAQEIDRGIDLAKNINQQLLRRDDVECAQCVDMNLVCFRPKGWTDDAMSARHAELATNQSWLSLSAWRGRLWFRMVILSPETKREHVQNLLQELLIVKY